jgi:hypothetical protein
MTKLLLKQIKPLFKIEIFEEESFQNDIMLIVDAYPALKQLDETRKNHIKKVKRYHNKIKKSLEKISNELNKLENYVEKCGYGLDSQFSIKVQAKLSSIEPELKDYRNLNEFKFSENEKVLKDDILFESPLAEKVKMKHNYLFKLQYALFFMFEEYSTDAQEIDKVEFIDSFLYGLGERNKPAFKNGHYNPPERLLDFIGSIKEEDGSNWRASLSICT